MGIHVFFLGGGGGEPTCGTTQQLCLSSTSFGDLALSVNDGQLDRLRGFLNSVITQLERSMQTYSRVTLAGLWMEELNSSAYRI